jgi:hypothetical protein
VFQYLARQETSEKHSSRDNGGSPRHSTSKRKKAKKKANKRERDESTESVIRRPKRKKHPKRRKAASTSPAERDPSPPKTKSVRKEGKPESDTSPPRTKSARKEGKPEERGHKRKKELTPPVVEKVLDPDFLAMITCQFCPEPRVFAGHSFARLQQKLDSHLSAVHQSAHHGFQHIKDRKVGTKVILIKLVSGPLSSVFRIRKVSDRILGSIMLPISDPTSVSGCPESRCQKILFFPKFFCVLRVVFSF